MYKVTEKRKYKRIETPYLTRIRIKPYETRDTDFKDWLMVIVNDLGAGGIFFHVRRNLGIGTALDLKIDLSASMPSVECRGVVTRAKKYPYTSIFGIAASFTEIDEQIKEMINKTALFVIPDN